MTRSTPTPHRNLETSGRPEGGAGGTGPVVVPPATPAKARRVIFATLRQLIDTLTDLEQESSSEDGGGQRRELPLLLDAVEAARLLSISRAKVLDLAARGEMPSLRIGGSVRIPRDFLQTWIAERTSGTGRTSIPLPEWAHRWSSES
jgi:excisionase family DNA binding protein